MTSKSDTLTQSLIDYINDVKPYHTKFRDVSSQIFFSDSFNVNVKDDHSINYYLQNVWGRDDVGGYLLTNLSEGDVSDQTYHLPDTIFPRFSLTDYPNQTPPGDDPSTATLIDPWLTVAGDFVPGNAYTIVSMGPTGPYTDFSLVGATGPTGPVIGDTFIASWPLSTDIAHWSPTVDPDPTTGTTGTASLKTESHQIGVYDQIPVEPPIISFSQIGTNFTIVIDNIDETRYGFVETNMQVTVTVNAGYFTIGTTYEISDVGTTDFTLIGASNNLVGTTFTATGVGAGDGKAKFTLESGSFIKNGNTIEIATEVYDLSCVVEVLYLTTGRYAVPYHQGSRVRVNGNDQILGTNYIVDHSRSFIQFLPQHDQYGVTIGSSWPTAGVNVDINIYRSDKLYICWQDPFAFGTNADKFTIIASAAPSITTAGSFVIGETYKILETGTTDFTLIGATSNTVGLIFTASNPVYNMPVYAGSFVIGQTYVIELLGSTDFTLLGAASNNLGVSFVATGTGTSIGAGTGAASLAYNSGALVGTGTGTAASSKLLALSMFTAEIVAGRQYTILTSDSNFTFIGSADTKPGTVFTATSSGTSTPSGLVIDAYYQIVKPGNTDFVALGAADNNVGTAFTVTSGIVNTGSFVTGMYYQITSTGTTNFTLIGAPTNAVGTFFTANFVGVDPTTGTGTATAKVGTGVASLWSIYTPGIVAPTVQCDVTFSNTQPQTHKAILTDAIVTDLSHVGTWTVTATSHWNFKVEGPTIGTAKFKSAYDDGILSFLIDRTWANYYMTPTVDFVAYYIEQDVNSYISYDLSVLGTSDGYDATEFFSDLSITSEHGDSTSALMHPVRFEPFGIVKKDYQGHDYVFEFDSIPPPYTYIEFRVEEADQYNNWVSTRIVDEAFIKVTYQGIVYIPLIPGNTYQILTQGTTDFTTVGANSNLPGTVFVATDIGTGTGTVLAVDYVIVSGPALYVPPVVPVAPNAPNNVVAALYGTGYTTATLTITPGYSGGSPTLSYTVTNLPFGATDAQAGTPNLIRDLSGLTPGSTYTFDVTATNIVGTSLPFTSNPITMNVMPPSAPSVSSTLGACGTTVSTLTITPPVTGAPILGYNVTISPPGPIDTNAGSASTTHLITGLSLSTGYYVTVTATNVAGTGPAGDVGFTTRGLPTAPSSVTVTVGVSGQATINIGAANGNGCSITEYVVTWNGAGTDTNAGTANLNHVITGLTNGNTYTFTVYAVNAYGAGPSVSSAITTIPTWECIIGFQWDLYAWTAYYKGTSNLPLVTNNYEQSNNVGAAPYMSFAGYGVTEQEAFDNATQLVLNEGPNFQIKASSSGQYLTYDHYAAPVQTSFTSPLAFGNYVHNTGYDFWWLGPGTLYIGGYSSGAAPENVGDVMYITQIGFINLNLPLGSPGSYYTAT